IIENFRKELLNDNRKINVTDFGAGSRVFKSNERKVSDIAKNAGISRKRAILLNKLTSWFDIRSALELGTSVGISSAAIAAGNNVLLNVVEWWSASAEVAWEYYRHCKLNNINMKVGSLKETLKKQAPNSKAQIPTPTFQTPNSKFQAPGKFQYQTEDQQPL